MPLLRVWSVIVTLFGDVVRPRGGSVWLGSITEAMALLRIDPGAVRTAMSRLSTDGWVERDKAGRNAYYRLSPSAVRQHRAASEVVYAGKVRRPEPWDGLFHLAVIGTGAEDRLGLRGDLAHEGYKRLNASTFVALHPPTDPEAVVAHGALLFEARADEATFSRVVEGAFGLAGLAEAFTRFREAFDPVLSLAEAEALRPETAFALRLLMVHGFRRMVLRASGFPPNLLPPDWPGAAARDLAAALYAALAPASEDWIAAQVRDASGPLAPPADPVATRLRPSAG